jgi:fatty-acyl-CoA synthase
LLDEGDTEISWPVLDENTACGLCYTSGTTGNPKGVLYSHRSNVLHAMAMQFNDTQAISSRDRVMPIVPMFHANAWALAFAGPMAGADMIMPGAKLDGASVYELLTQERVTICAGVPTIYQMLLQFMEQDPARALPDLNRVIIGGSACPESMLRTFVEKYGVEVRHGWGMTETSPVASVNVLKGSMAHLAGEDRWAAMAKQGRPQFTVEMKIAGDAGAEIIHDGKAFGRLHVRGPAIAASYFRSDAKEAFVEDGWFDTGDVATIDAWGFMQITDRSKDVIKSGGEWISSIELENIAAGCEGVAEAAAIGLPHPKWDERPVLIIVSKPGAELSRGQVLAHMAGKVAKWWMPDDVIFVDEIPHTAAGKISKVQLREQFKFHQLLQS